MQGKKVKACTTLVALHGQQSGFMLHRKVISHCAGSIANEVECGTEPFFGKEFAEEIVEGALSKRIDQGYCMRKFSERTWRTGGGRRSEGSVLSPAARSYIFTARLWSTRFVPGIFETSARISFAARWRQDVRLPS